MMPSISAEAADATDAVIEPRESKEVVPATAIARRGAIEGQRQHDIDRIGSADLEREHDPVAHDADDLRWDTVDGNEGADHGRVGPERRRQKASVRIATGAAPAASSSARKARPSRGGTPRTS